METDLGMEKFLVSGNSIEIDLLVYFEIHFIYIYYTFMIDFFSVGSLTYKMLVLTLSTFFTMVSTLTRSSIDYNTVVGNCSAERPVFGRPVKGGEIGCYGKYDMIETLPYQRTQVFEVNFKTSTAF